LPNADQGFKRLFAKKPFPGYRRKSTWVHAAYEGNRYTINGKEEGWLCPPLFKYFDTAAERIFVKADAKTYVDKFIMRSIRTVANDSAAATSAYGIITIN